MMTLRRPLGSFIRDLRTLRGWSQEHLSEVAGVATRTIQRIEAGASVRHGTLLDLAASLDVDVATLVRLNKGGHFAIQVSEPRGGPKTSVPVVLVADDDPDYRALFRAAWVRCRTSDDIRFFSDGSELLAHLHRPFPGRTNPTLILLDLDMPGINGYEVLDELRADPDLARIPVIVLTGVQEDEDVERVYEFGANGFVRKPRGPSELFEIISSLGRFWLDVARLPA